MTLPGWKSTVPGGHILTPGNARKYETGEWRSSQRPLWHPERCIHCLFCWVYCPDGCIEVKDGKMTGIDLAYCKGCGICAHECPVKGDKAITMAPEGEQTDGAKGGNAQ